MKQRLIVILLSMWTCLSAAVAQTAEQEASMSPLVRRLCRQVRAELRQTDAHSQSNRTLSVAQAYRSMLALVKADAGGEAALIDNSCRIVDRIGTILVVDIPLRSLPRVVESRGVMRVEAERGRQLLLDTMAVVTNAQPIYDAISLPQAYRGSGVVMGVMDAGFDLTHPNFYDADLTTTRISKFWDQIAEQQSGDTLYVGREFTSTADILAYQHSRDNEVIHHGTHTLGIAAGAGAGTPYVGMAPEAELCLVNNAVTDDLRYIPDSLEYRYTYATDVLGFKYIFDYAASVGRPCVISFSEGSTMDFVGNDILFGEALEQLVGPGRILVASAGNTGWYRTCLHKPEGTEHAGAYIRSSAHTMPLTLTSNGDAVMRFATHGDSPSQLDVSVSSVVEAADSTLYLEFGSGDYLYQMTLEAYTSCYDSQTTAIDISFASENMFGIYEGLTVELLGTDVDAKLFCWNGGFTIDPDDDQYDDAEYAYNVNSPSSLPSVISVGATSWRKGWAEESGYWHYLDYGSGGERATYSSRGPTLDGRVKPDVMAPGTNIISSGSSFYMQTAYYDKQQTVSETYFGDNTYPWVVMSGTSMSSPAVGGIVALWLQANPELSPSDVLDIIRQTSDRIGTATEHSDNACGYGAINAYAGLLMALGLDGISDLPQYQVQNVSIQPVDGNSVRVSFAQPTSQTVCMSIYSINGQKLKQLQIGRGETQVTVEIPHPQTGVYAVALRSADRNLTGSSLIRL